MAEGTCTKSRSELDGKKNEQVKLEHVSDSQNCAVCTVPTFSMWSRSSNQHSPSESLGFSLTGPTVGRVMVAEPLLPLLGKLGGTCPVPVIGSFSQY